MLNNLFAKKNQALIDENEYPSISEWASEKESEDQLSIDVYQTSKTIVIKADMAGVKPEDLKVSLHNDLLTIKCHKKNDVIIDEADYFYKECRYGVFSRSIILPAEVDNHKVEAILENGLLTVTLNKIDPNYIEVIKKD